MKGRWLLALVLAVSILVITPSLAIAELTWQPRTITGSENFDDISFADREHGWAVGHGGTILHTSDGGVSWTTQASIGTALRAVHFFDRDTGMAVGDGGKIIATTDGGATWTPVTSGTTAALYDVDFANPTRGWAVGTGGTILATTDGGSTWTQQSSGTTATLTGVSFYDANKGIAVGMAGTVVNTSTGGTTWTVRTSPTTQQLNAVIFYSSNIACAVGNSGTIIHTYGGGSSWQKTTSGTPRNLYAVDYVGGRTYVAGAWGEIVTSSDRINWTVRSTGVMTNLWGITCVDAGRVWASGIGAVVRGLDLTGPTTAVRSPGSWQTYSGSTLTISGTSVDDVASVTAVEVSTDGGNTWSAATGTADWSFVWTLPAADKQLYTIRARGIDSDGNVGPGGVAYYWVDTVAPVTTLSTTPTAPDGNDSWFKTAPSVTLTRNQAGITYFQWDSTASGGWMTYISPFTAPPGAHTLHYYSVDSFGNIEEVRSHSISTDGMAPTSDIMLHGASAEDGWFVSDVTVKLDATDNPGGSGVASFEYSLDGITWQSCESSLTVSQEGTTTISYRSIDVAGNVEESKQSTFLIDRTPPLTSAEATGTLGMNGWYVSDVALSLDATDTGGSGVAWTECANGSRTYEGPVMVTGEGTTIVSYRSFDGAGNVEDERQSTVKIDKTSPMTVIRLIGDQRMSGTYRSGVQAALIAVDALGGSGVDVTQYSLDGESWSTYESPILIDMSGETIIRYRSIDSAGNVESSGSRTIVIE